MARSKSDARSTAAWGMAARQYGLVTRQLLALGFTRRRSTIGSRRGACAPLPGASMPSDCPPELPGNAGWRRSWPAVRAPSSATAVPQRFGGSEQSARTGRARSTRPSRAAQPPPHHERRTGHPAAPVTCDRAPPAPERAVNEADKRDLTTEDRRALAGAGASPTATIRLSDSDLEIFFGRSPRPPNRSSTDSKSTSTGPSSACVERTACATTAPPPDQGPASGPNTRRRRPYRPALHPLAG